MNLRALFFIPTKTIKFTTKKRKFIMMSAASVVMLNYCIQKGQKRTVEHLHGKTIYFPGFQHQRSN